MASYDQEQIEVLLDEMSYEILDYKQIQKLKEIVVYLSQFKEVKLEHINIFTIKDKIEVLLENQLEFVKELDHLRLNFYKQTLAILKQNPQWNFSNEILVQSEHKIMQAEAQIMERLLNTKVIKKKNKKKIFKSRPKNKTKIEFESEEEN